MNYRTQSEFAQFGAVEICSNQEEGQYHQVSRELFQESAAVCCDRDPGNDSRSDQESGDEPRYPEADFPLSVLSKLIGSSRASEIDIVLDLWLCTIYKDEHVLGSDIGPVVYYRNGTGNPLISYNELSLRWKRSRSSVGRLLKKLRKKTNGAAPQEAAPQDPA